MGIIKDKKITERYGEYEEKPTIYSKFRARKDSSGNLKYRGRENKTNKLTREIYNFKGQIIFRFKVSSYKKVKNTIIRDFVSEEEIVVERSQLQSNLKEAIENGKLQAVYSHYSKKGERWRITEANYGKIKNEIVKIELLDYIVNYNKGYNRKLGLPRAKFVKDENNNMNISLYDDKTKKYVLYSSTEHKKINDIKRDIEMEQIDSEKNYVHLY